MSNLVDSKVLENLLIKEEDNRMDIVEEGIFSKMRERKENKRIMREEQKKARAEWRSTYDSLYSSYINPQFTKILNQIKHKYSKYNLPWSINLHNTNASERISIDISVFKNEWCMNEYCDNYDPKCVEAFDDCFNSIEEWCNANSKNGKLENYILKANVIENNIITIMVE